MVMVMAGSIDTGALRRYRLRSPAGEVFDAAIVYADNELRVVTDRSGQWQPDATIQVADLIMPEQNFDDWDVEKLPLDPPPTAAPPEDALPESVPGLAPKSGDIDYNKAAQVLLNDDLARIEASIRGSVSRGEGAKVIGRRIVGSASLDGVDGVTETTRQKIARLGVAAIKRLSPKR